MWAGGILGTGGIARSFTRDLLTAGLRLVAVGSRSAEGAEAFGREFGLERRHGSYEALCADPEVDESISLSLAWEGGQRASLHSDMLSQGPNRAAILGEKAWVEFEPIWFCQSAWKLRSRDGRLLRRFEERVEGRGMQCQALELEARVAEGRLESPLMSHAATIEGVEMMDEARARIGLRHPSEG